MYQTYLAIGELSEADLDGWYTNDLVLEAEDIVGDDLNFHEAIPSTDHSFLDIHAST